MVKLAMNTATELQGQKPPYHPREPLLNDTVKVPLERDTVVHMRQGNRRYQRRHVVGLVIAGLIILAVGGALAGFYFTGHFRTGEGPDDQCPGCKYHEPQDHGYHDEHRDGHDHGGESGGRSGEQGKDKGGHGGERGKSGRGRGENDGKAGPRPHKDPKGEHAPDVDKSSQKGHRGRFGPKGVFDGHPRSKHHLPLP
ncbi:uncharacterized protein LOC119725542 [Patiria miniata]|uniref:Uncharacterized protein n=1 Tax=Patiria miniata TaxID=46514 RepID=A0A913ZPC5_PATMI|nr:uncharacterized protein LOC119725542 [Patiria miniata]